MSSYGPNKALFTPYLKLKKKKKFIKESEKHENGREKGLTAVG